MACNLYKNIAVESVVALNEDDLFITCFTSLFLQLLMTSMPSSEIFCNDIVPNSEVWHFPWVLVNNLLRKFILLYLILNLLKLLLNGFGCHPPAQAQVLFLVIDA